VIGSQIDCDLRSPGVYRKFESWNRYVLWYSVTSRALHHERSFGSIGLATVTGFACAAYTAHAARGQHDGARQGLEIETLSPADWSRQS